MKDFILKNSNKFIYSAFSIIIIIAVWFISANIIGEELILPTPIDTGRKIIEIINGKEFMNAIVYTTLRTAFGVIISFLMAIILGTAAGIFPAVDQILGFMVMLIRTLPTMAIIIIMLITLGGSVAAILVEVFVLFPFLYSNIVAGIKDVDKQLLEMASIYQITRYRLLKDIYFPSLTSYIKSGLQGALGLGFKVMISAEVMGEVKNSIGKQLMLHKVNFDMAGVFAWCILLIILVSVWDLLLFSTFKYRK